MRPSRRPGSRVAPVPPRWWCRPQHPQRRALASAYRFAGRACEPSPVTVDTNAVGDGKMRDHDPAVACKLVEHAHDALPGGTIPAVSGISSTATTTWRTAVRANPAAVATHGRRAGRCGRSPKVRRPASGTFDTALAAIASHTLCRNRIAGSTTVRTGCRKLATLACRSPAGVGRSAAAAGHCAQVQIGRAHV